MKGCELCSNPATIYCEADIASLCSNCDHKVHSANFLVAKHSRNLLCHVCQSPTPWTASGTKLGHTVSVCNTCVENSGGVKQQGRRRGNLETEGRPPRELGDEITEVDFDGAEDEYSDDDELSESSEDDEYEDEEGGDNQVVPWSYCSSTTPPSPPPPPLASSSSSEAVSSNADGGGGGVSASKRRTRENADLDSEVRNLSLPLYRL